MKCEYCGTDIMVREPVRPAHYVQLSQPAPQAPGNGANLKRLGHAAIAAGDFAEACDYFNRALELDPDDVDAWLGKADALGQESEPVNLRIQEMLGAFDSARAVAPGRNAELLDLMVARIKAVVPPLHIAAREQMLDAPTSFAWDGYLDQCAQLLAAADIAHRYAPEDTEILEFAIEVCRDNIEGVYVGGHEDFYAVSDVGEKKLRALMEAYSEKLAVFKPGYQYPMVQRAGKQCFVVTATMGDATHPSVVLLRTFRDEHLVRFSAGRAFIAWYWTHGPALARQVARSKAGRGAAYVLVVAPAVAVVKAFNRCRAR